MKKLVWLLGDVVKETIITGPPALCRWKMNQIKHTTHRSGKLKIVPHN